VVALAAILIVTGINCLAVKVSGGVADRFVRIKIALCCWSALVLSYLRAAADWSHLLMANVGGTCKGSALQQRFGFAASLRPCSAHWWAYDGWNNVTLVAGEVKIRDEIFPVR